MCDKEARAGIAHGRDPLDPDEKLDEALEESFPASDPIAVAITGIRLDDGIGEKRKDRSA